MTLRIRRNRPENAPGANHLRGGKGQYSTRTKVGNWVEDETEGPLVPGFVSEAMLSTTQLQQLEGQGRPVRIFGGGLPAEVKKTTPTTNPIVTTPITTSDHWMSTTHLLHRIPDAEAEASAHPSSPSRDVQEYRKHWTSENPVARSLRFQTVSMAAANQGVPEKFRARPLRILPGTPLAVEHLRERLVQTHGNLGLVSLHNVLVKMDTTGDGVLDRSELQQGLAKEFGIALSKVDAKQIFDYFDKNGDGVIDIAEFVHGLQGELSVERARAVRDIFCSRISNAPDGEITPAALRELCHLAALPQPDLQLAFQHDLQSLSNHSSIRWQDFEALHRSLSALCSQTSTGDSDFLSLIDQLWLRSGN